MRPTFLGIQTALTGIRSNQKSLDIVGQNLTNLYTPGYTRQRVDVVSQTLSGSGRYDVNGTTTLAGQGTDITGVSQLRDPFLDKRFREEYSTVSYYDTTATIIDDIESTLDELGDVGLKNSFEEILSALKSFSSNPDQETNASILRTSMEQLTSVLHQFDQKLAEIGEQQKFNLEVAVDDFNSITERIAHLNQAIAEAKLKNTDSDNSLYGPNELLDERNLLLDQLAYYGDINVEEVENGIVNVTLKGETVIEGYKAETLSINETPQGPVQIFWGSGNEFDSIGGALKATTDMINGAGPNVKYETETFEKGVPYYRYKLDDLAYNFADAFNNVIPLEAGGYVQLFEATDGGAITASKITLTQAWQDDASYIMDDIVQDGELDNKHILDMIALFDEEHSFSEYTGTFDGFVNFVNTSIGQQKTFNTSRLEATASVADDMLDRRDAISAVNMDEEAANMMMYEKAYQAVARVMTTMDEALNTIINGMGLVGR